VAPDGTVTRPARLSGVEEHPLGEELLVYDPRSETAYALNRSAVAIWLLCDGTRTVEEITNELGQFVGLSGAALLPDVIQGVTRLHESGLLEFR
jgi:pyrroloquinoline quinone biosynthesis protein D